MRDAADWGGAVDDPGRGRRRDGSWGADAGAAPHGDDVFHGRRAYSWRIVHALTPVLAVAGACWLLAFGHGYGHVPSWAVGVSVLVLGSVVVFVWLVSKVAHGGDWACRSRSRTLTRPDHTVRPLYGTGDRRPHD